MKNNFVENVGRTLFDQWFSNHETGRWNIRDYAIVVERMKKGEEEFALQNICGSSDVEMMCVCLWYGFVTTS